MHIFLRGHIKVQPATIVVAAETKVVKPFGRVLIRLDLHMAIFKGYYGQIAVRSSLASTCGIIVYDGTIDLDYRGNVCVVLFNLSHEEHLVKVGNGTAQLIIERCFTPKFVEVSKFMDEKIEQGGKGFDTSGV